MIDNNKVLTAKKPTPTEHQEISAWFNSRDYSVLKTLTVGEFITEIEERLDLYEDAKLCKGNIGDRRWPILEDGVLIKKVNSPRAEFLETEGISVLSMTDLAIFLELKDKIPKYTSTTPDIHKAEENQVNLLKDKYLAPSPKGQEKIIMSIDLMQSNEELIKQFADMLNVSRQKLKIENPDKKIKTPKLGSLKKFTNYKSIQYFDLLIYCLIKPNVLSRDISKRTLPRKEPIYWQLSDQDIATLFDPLELDASHIKDWRRVFYMPKLFNHQYMAKYFEEIKSNPADLTLNIPL